MKPGSVNLHLCVDILIGTSHQAHYSYFCLPCHPLDCSLVALVDTYIVYGGTIGFMHFV